MTIRCNRVISAAIFVVFVVTSVNSKNVRQLPAVTSMNTTTTVKVSEPVDDTTAMKPINGTANNSTATSSVEGTAATQPVTIANPGTGTETQTDENGLLVDKNVIVHPIRKHDGGTCPRGYSVTSNGNCKPTFNGK
ncbi:unnamed protein product [Macrosiphum euphorbiae]|uniref:Secreted protein n=1 Tax=Macrosiphum euphorbiae TaxID=13131 RepID=A0AAV0X8G2_9HEMI|nr:unnamed protein product [Macrosiphum euphorbiae]